MKIVYAVYACLVGLVLYLLVRRDMKNGIPEERHSDMVEYDPESGQFVDPANGEPVDHDWFTLI